MFAEAEYRNISVGSDERKTLSYSLEAFHAASLTSIVQDISDLTMAERRARSRKVITSSSNVEGNTNFDPDQPSDEARSYINIGGLGVTAGIRVDL